MEIQLYYAPITCSLVPYITLTEAGAEFEVMPINMRKGQNKTPEYLKLNPKHKVPVLVVNGEPLSENVAIQIWIARNFPKAQLLPQDPWQELKAISMLSWCSSGIHPYLSLIHSPLKVCDLPEAEESILKKSTEIVFDCFSMAEDLLKGREYFFDHFTASDAHFFWCYRRASQFELDLSSFPICAAHFERMQTRDSVQKLIGFEKKIQAQFAGAA
ncbi:MAG: glutathione S-transferase family protein [Rhodospirillales bacterium]|jgi:glutathione S-transferase|nr:glutathione S-transferase family protein [Rhodospirillales bacterium]MBT4005641.1 glutathione S-transferase family protein [Rhodospirillales bacterium]MBT5075841.1 glutathione S-transferase family protein [Rhodospirillales bacterium]MBT5113296.1 glutathione S-transferase family protein [Rhodospirillales bacterium]MBT5672122.1 glutathione S-transferase family protein [Rhodospirillales bacterium]